jgi:hypothetical protein
MKTIISKTAIVFATLVLSFGLLSFGAMSALAQDAFPGGTTLGGSSAFTGTPPVGSDPAPTYGSGSGPGTGGLPTGTGGGSSTQTSSRYCSGVSGTLLASGSKVSDVMQFFTCFIQSSILPLLFMLALAVFIWGMVKFIASGQSSDKEEGQQFMLWGIIALTVMFSVWGLVKILGDTFGVSNVVPQLTTNPK